jgi:hypothetical protein
MMGGPPALRVLFVADLEPVFKISERRQSGRLLQLRFNLLPVLVHGLRRGNTSDNSYSINTTSLLKLTNHCPSEDEPCCIAPLMSPTFPREPPGHSPLPKTLDCHSNDREVPHTCTRFVANLHVIAYPHPEGITLILTHSACCLLGTYACFLFRLKQRQPKNPHNHVFISHMVVIVYSACSLWLRSSWTALSSYGLYSYCWFSVGFHLRSKALAAARRLACPSRAYDNFWAPCPILNDPVPSKVFSSIHPHSGANPSGSCLLPFI